MDTLTALLFAFAIVGLIAMIRENAKFRRHEFLMCDCGEYNNYSDLKEGKYCPRCGKRGRWT